MKRLNLTLKLILLCSCLFPFISFAQYYKLVTSAEQLTQGDKYLIVNVEHQKAIGRVDKNKKNQPAIDVDIKDGIITNIGEAEEFTLEKRAAGYSFKCSEHNGYLCATSNSSNELTHDMSKTPNEYSKANIVINEDYTASIEFITGEKNKIRYNYDSNLFNCYSSGQEPVSLFKYSAEDASKLFQTLQFSTSSATVDIGETFIEPTLSGAETNVSYSSSNPNVATVNANTGKVKILDVGTTTIRAIAEATEIYNMGSAYYTLTVKPLEELFDFTQPDKFGFTLPNPQTIIDKDIVKGIVTISVTHGTNTETRFYKSTNDGIFLGIYKGGSITFSVPENYLIKTIQFTANNKNDLKGLPNVSNNQWTNNSDTTQSVTFEVTEAVKITTANVYYKKIQEPVVTQEITISSAGYSTFSSENPIVVPEGLQAGIVNIDDGLAIVHYIYSEGDTIPSSSGVLLKGNAGTYELIISNTDVETEMQTENYLRAAATNDTISAPHNEKFYILAKDSENGLGFYYQGANGDGNKVWNIKGKAYLAVNVASAVKGFRIDGKSLTTIKDINQPITTIPVIYNLSGTKIKKSKGKNLPKGIYIIDGKKYVVK